MKIKVLFAGLITIALFNTAYSQTLDKAKLDQFFDRLNEKNKAMGSLSVAKSGDILYARAIGYSQINGVEKKTSNASTRYRIGSVTKMFTAVMIFQFIEQGKLNKFKFEATGVFLEFDVAKNQMTFKQRGREIVFTKEN